MITGILITSLVVLGLVEMDDIKGRKAPAKKVAQYFVSVSPKFEF